MKRSNDEIDTLIREALDREDAAVFEELGELSLFERALEVIRGRQRWIAILVMAVTLAFLAGAVYSAVRFFRTEDVHQMFTWAGGFFFCMMIVLALKIWYWMEMNRQTMSREIKRLELQVAHLLEVLREEGRR